MVLIRRYPYFSNFDEDDNRNTNRFDIQRTRCIPAINVVETNDNYRLEVAAPGLSKEHFKIDVDHNTLTLSSGHEEQEENGETTIRKEFCYGRFERSFVLPDSVESDKISAKHENGILFIILPKREEAKVKPPREIKIA